jgi:hypothetical protein
MSSRKGSSIESRSLARIFCYLLTHWSVGVNSSHIAGVENTLADTLSQNLDHNYVSYNSPIPFATPSLSLQIPQIHGWQCYQPSHELLKLLLSALCTGSAPIPITKIPLGQLKDTLDTGLNTVTGTELTPTLKLITNANATSN